MPNDAKVLHFAEQGEQLCLWCEVDPQNPPERRVFRVVGTGHTVDGLGLMRYIGTAHEGPREAPLVWHLYEDWLAAGNAPPKS
jgi:hypothetical protein